MKTSNIPLQCDETQPECRRCIKSKRLCYGMRTVQSCPDIYIENSYASGQSKRPRGPRSAPRINPTVATNTISYSLPNDLRTRAIAYYLHFHLQPLQDATDLSDHVLSVSDHLLPIWISQADCPMLDHAVSAMALAVFSRTQHHPPAAIEASLRYHRLLQMTQSTILSLDQGNFDACLIAIFCMSRYEEVVHHPDSPKVSHGTALKSFSHHDGSLAVLKLWKSQFSHTRPATDVIKHTRRGLIRSALLRNLAVPVWMRNAVDFGERGLDVEYDRIVVQLTNLRQRFSMLIQGMASSPEPANSFEELDKEASDLDNALHLWTTSFPSSWSNHRHILFGSHNPSPGRSLGYQSSAHAATWSQYYATRMLINSMRLKIMRVLEIFYPESYDSILQQRVGCLSRMKVMAAELQSTVPLCLQSLKVKDNSSSTSRQVRMTSTPDIETKPYMASMIVWPLTIASGLEDIELGQRMWFRSELARLGRLTGFGLLELAETHWIEF